VSLVFSAQALQLRLEFGQTPFSVESLQAFGFRLPLSLVLQSLGFGPALLGFGPASLRFNFELLGDAA
jgi:hypothetical protein